MNRTVSATCVECSRIDTVEVKAERHDKYLLREGLVQNLFPKLSAQEREMIVQADKPWTRSSWATYYCEGCWELFEELDTDESEVS